MQNLHPDFPQTPCFQHHFMGTFCFTDAEKISPHLPVPYIFGTRGLYSYLYWQLGARCPKYVGSWKMRGRFVCCLTAHHTIFDGMICTNHWWSGLGSELEMKSCHE